MSLYSRKRDRATFNRWLRFRIVAQGVTVAACVAGSYVLGADAREKRASEAEQHKREDEERERRRFQARLKEAEEAQRLPPPGMVFILICCTLRGDQSYRENVHGRPDKLHKVNRKGLITRIVGKYAPHPSPDELSIPVAARLSI